MNASSYLSSLATCLLAVALYADTRSAKVVSDDLTAKIDVAAQSAAATFWIGVKTLDEDGDGKVALTKLVKTLQSRGFARPAVAASEGGAVEGRGRQRRGRGTPKSDLQFIKRLDPSKDKHVEKSEVATAFRSIMLESVEAKLALDANRDGKISLPEYALSSPAKGGKTDENGINWHQRSHFEREDPNKDGVITGEEVLGRYERRVFSQAEVLQLTLRLHKADRNGNGELNLEECESVLPGWRVDSNGVALVEFYDRLRRLSTEDWKKLSDAL